MKSRILWAFTVGGLLSYAAMPHVQSEEAEEHVGLQSVPQAAMDAAEEAVDGIEFEEAEVEAVLVYELEGTADGKEVEIEITTEGQVISTEIEAEDDAKAEASEDDAAEGDDESKPEADEEEELEIPVASIPKSVLEAAVEAVEGFEAEAAIVEPALIYALEGEAKGVEYEVEVTSEGDLVEVEKDVE